jgi:hypothetical protein
MFLDIFKKNISLKRIVLLYSTNMSNGQRILVKFEY